MSKKVLVNLDMNGNQIQNVVMQSLATAPASPKEGQYYYNSADKKAYQWNGSAWKPLGGTEITVDTALSGTSTNPVQNKVINGALGNKVDKVTGKGLSSNDYTDAEKQQLANLVAGTITVDSALSDSSENPVQNKVIKEALDQMVDTGDIATGISGDTSSKIPNGSAVMAYVAAKLSELPKEQFLDLTKTTFVQSFAWSSTTYPGSTNPNLDGKPVMVLALKNSSDNTVAYSFLNMYELVDTYTGTSPITVSGRTISHAETHVSAGSYGNDTDRTLGFGEAFEFPNITVDDYGHLTFAQDTRLCIPNTEATISKAGLMSTSDKLKLDNLTSAGVTSVGLWNTSIEEGETSSEVRHTLPGGDLVGYTAFSAGEEVIVDVEGFDGFYTFSVSTAASSDIFIYYMMATTS